MQAPHRPILRLSLALGLSLAALGMAHPRQALAQSGLPCGPIAGPTPQALLAGMTAVTCFSGLTGTQVNTAPVVAVIDSRVPIVPPNTDVPVLGLNWCAPSFHGPNDSWTNNTAGGGANLGQVFGITIDDATPPNIYVAASTAYGSNVPPTTAFSQALPTSPFGMGGAGAVYRLDGATGAISIWAQLPNTGPALGNIDFDPLTKHFFVSNFEDGRVYNLVDVAGTGSCVEAYDHATDTVTAGCAPEAGDAPGFATLGARPWGVQVHNGRLYYGLWVEDIGRVQSTGSNEVWSVPLASGQIGAGRQLEVSVASLAGLQYSHPISDLSFASTGRMIIAERGMGDDVGPGLLPASGVGAHRARNLEYFFNGGWQPSLNVFGIGANTSGSFTGANSTGGNDFDCEDNLWSTGNALLYTYWTTQPGGGSVGSPNWNNGTVYGMQRTPNTGNGGTINMIATTGYFVDFDGQPGWAIKGGIGDVVHSACGPTPPPIPTGCITLSEGSVSCEVAGVGLVPTGCWLYDVTVTNASSSPIVHLDIPSTNVTPNTVNFTPPLMPNTSKAVTLRICGAPTGSFTLTLLPMQLGSDPCCDALKETLQLELCAIPTPLPPGPFPTTEPPLVSGIAGDGEPARPEGEASRSVMSWLSRLMAWFRGSAPATSTASASAELAAVPARPLAAAPARPSVPQACIAPPANLRAWFTLDEAGGNSARDIVGGLVGAVQGGGGAQSQGRVGIGRTFDGIDDVVVVPDNPALDVGTGDFSVDFWVRPGLNDSPVERPLVSKMNAPTDVPIGYKISLVGGNLVYGMGSQGESLVAQVSPNAWHLVALTLSRGGGASSGTVYLDGQPVHTFGDVAGSLDTSASFMIGGLPSLGRGIPAAYFEGTIDEVEVFNRALSRADILAIFNAGAEGKCKTGPTPTPPANLTGMIQSERGCVEAGQSPVYYTGETLRAQLRVDGVSSVNIRVMGLGGAAGPVQLDSGTVTGGTVYNMTPTTIGAGTPGARILVLEAFVEGAWRELARCSFAYGGDRPRTVTPGPTPTATATPSPTATPTNSPTPTATPRPTGCLDVTDVRLLCSTGQPHTYQLQLQFTNTGTSTIDHLFLHPLSTGVSLGQTYFGGLNLPPSTGIGLIPITLTSWATPGTVLCLQLAARDSGFSSCCVQTVCFRVPCCPQCYAQEAVHVGWDRRYCKNKDSVIIPATICNYSGSPHTYSIIDLQTLPVGAHGMCNFDPGYLAYSVLDPPVTIMPGFCKTVRVEITRPAGLNTPMQMACYTLTVQNQGTGSTFTTDGSLLGPGNLWCVDSPPSPGGGGSGGGGCGTWPMATGQERDLTFIVTNTGDSAAQLTYAVTAVRSDMEGPNTAVSLDGLPPGTDVNGRLPLGAGATAGITVTVRVAPRPAGEPFDFHDILLMADLNGDGQTEPLDSIGVVRAGPTYIYLPSATTR